MPRTTEAEKRTLQGYNVLEATRQHLSSLTVMDNSHQIQVVTDEGFILGDLALRGRAIRQQYSLPTDREATTTEIFHNSRSFIQILGRKGGEYDQIASYSFGLSGGLDTIEDVIKNIDIGTGVVKTYKTDQIDDQINVFIEEEIEPEVMLARALLGPKAVYKSLTGLRRQNEVQNGRYQNLINNPSGKERFFVDIFNKKRDGLVRACQEGDGTAEFAWAYVNRGGELWGINVDFQPQSMTSLVMDPRVSQAMRDNTLDTQKFLTETPEGKRRYVLKIYADPTTLLCCPNATSAQLGDHSVIETQAFNNDEALMINQNANILSAKSEWKKIDEGSAAREAEKYCSTCSQTKNSEGKCGCNENNSH